MFNNYQQAKNIDGTINNSVIIGLPTGAWIPNNPDNTDWQNYQAWLAEGNTPLPPEA